MEARAMLSSLGGFLPCFSCSDDEDGDDEVRTRKPTRPGQVHAAAPWLESEAVKLRGLCQGGEVANLKASLARCRLSLSPHFHKKARFTTVALNWERLQGTGRLQGNDSWAHELYPDEIATVSDNISIREVEALSGGKEALVKAVGPHGISLELRLQQPTLLWMFFHPELGFHANLNCLLSMLCVCDQRGWMIAVDDSKWPYSYGAGGWLEYFQPFPSE
eukprot:5679279-Amphidinium_carterae.2